MSKKVPVYLSEDELKEIMRWNNFTAYKDQVDENLTERLESELATFEEPQLYEEDDDGYERLTEETREGLKERYMREDD